MTCQISPRCRSLAVVSIVFSLARRRYWRLSREPADQGRSRAIATVHQPGIRGFGYPHTGFPYGAASFSLVAGSGFQPYRIGASMVLLPCRAHPLTSWFPYLSSPSVRLLRSICLATSLFVLPSSALTSTQRRRPPSQGRPQAFTSALTIPCKSRRKALPLRCRWIALGSRHHWRHCRSGNSPYESKQLPGYGYHHLLVGQPLSHQPPKPPVQSRLCFPRYVLYLLAYPLLALL